MDLISDHMSEKVMYRYIEKVRLVNINAEDQHHLKKYARKLQYFEQRGKLVNYPMCDQPNSRRFRQMVAINIKAVCTSKDPGNKKANSGEQCYAKYNRSTFREHLEDREDCIYH